MVDQILNGSWDLETITKTVGGQYAFLEAREYYCGSQGNKEKIELYSRGMAIAPALALIWDPTFIEGSPVGAVIAISSVADYNFSLAQITENQIEKEIYSRLGKYLTDHNLENYWEEDVYGGYYKSIFNHGGDPAEGPLAFEQGAALSALVGAYGFTSDGFYLNRAMIIKMTLDTNLWDKDGKGYFAAANGYASHIKFLSGNNFIARAYLLWVQKLENDKRKEELLNYAKEITDFIFQELYVHSDYYSYFAHDTYNMGRYCSGCNFLTLYNCH